MNGGRNGSGFDFRLTVAQLDSGDFWGGSRTPPEDVTEESGKDNKNDLGNDASVKGEDTEHKVDELPGHASLNGPSKFGSCAFWVPVNGPGLGSALTRRQLCLDILAWT